MTTKQVEDLFSTMKTKTILVIGDVMLDHYIWGSVDRISPEAPVPVVNIQKETYTLGGAGNVAKNLSALGVSTLLMGVVGDDLYGEILQDKMKDNNIVSYLITDYNDKFTTTVKTRVIAHTQQVVRLDRENKFLSDLFIENEIESVFNNLVSRLDIDAVIISDYKKGVVTNKLVRYIVNKVSKTTIIGVDPKDRFSKYEGVDFITPNTKELSYGVNINIEDYDDLIDAGNKALEISKCSNVLVTRGEHGMTLIKNDIPNNYFVGIPSVARHVYDVTGAGDTVIAVYTTALCSGCDPEEAAKMANVAAGLVVGEVGAATVTMQQLSDSYLS